MSDSGLYVQLFSVHGLIRGDNLELGRDADTGGQVKYVIELCDHLSQREEIDQVDLFTRLIRDKRVSEDYGRAVEEINSKFRIIRIQCGGRKYIRKELLWPHLDEYTDKTVKFIKREERIPDVVHGHYPDGGYVAMELSRIFGLPFVYTGHSLGRSKKLRLAADGMSEKEMSRQYKIDRRIRVEEDVLKSADLVITSTHQEVEEQYGMYRNGNVPDFKVIPPGIGVDRFYPFYHDMLADSEKSEEQKFAQASMMQELHRFFMNPDRPLILALCRPDKRKNISGLIRAYGEDKALQAMANLAVFAGIRKDIDQMEDNERDVLTRMLLLLDKYDLYGKMAIPKKHDVEHEVPALYRIAAEKRGVFVNPALTEPFGITLLEASATGLPIVATNDGGPNDIVRNCENGILVDPTDSARIAEAIRTILTDEEAWERYSRNGILNVHSYYTWSSHAETYAGTIRKLVRKLDNEKMERAVPSNVIGRRLACLNAFVVTDIDNTLIGEENGELEALLKWLAAHREGVGFAVATGRTIDSTVAYLKENGVPQPDVYITSVGSEIYYGRTRHPGQGWRSHISKQWDREKIARLLKDFNFLTYQEEDTQREFKVSYDMKPGRDRLARIHDRLLRHKCRYNLIYSHQKYLDILPWRASKGKAIRYLSYKWEIPLANFIVCGDSGNDEEMLRGEPMGVVVGNYSEELKKLRGRKRIFFAKKPCAGGILEGIRHYGFEKKATGRCD
ncbi:MAG: HAD-IIB family hydrolase [Desulfobacteraceae bacterium]|nr:HAD-IIB family hydrolase [Desulfobacteraceae bacterium]